MAAASSATACLALGLYNAECDLDSLIPSSHAESEREHHKREQAVKNLRAWLVEQGADMQSLDIVDTQKRGLGLFANEDLKSRARWPWWRRLLVLCRVGGEPSPVTVMSVPDHLILCADNLVKDPDVGPLYQDMMKQGLLDERTVIMMALMVEKLRASQSRYAPWLDLLPTTFHSPLWFTSKELEELRGTSLYQATKLHQRHLANQWSRLQPACTPLFRTLGLYDQPGEDDWKWAYSIFWSRGQSLPLPVKGGPRAEGPTDSAATGPVHSPANPQGDTVEVVEGIVPGLDLCNHQSPANCWWEVHKGEGEPRGVAANKAPRPNGSADAASSEQEPGGPPHVASPSFQVRLLTTRKECPRVGQELFMDYGEKSNEELLMLYGFVEEGNVNDRVMLHCPLPPTEEWDDVLWARMELLQCQGLRPQFFLSSHRQVDLASTSDVLELLPEGALGTLQAFVITPKEVAEKLEALQAASAVPPSSPEECVSQSDKERENPGGGHQETASKILLGSESRGSGQQPVVGSGQCSEGELRRSIEHEGLRLAVITTLSRLLELRMNEQEGPEGTGLLEDDLKYLESGPLHRSPPVDVAGYRQWLSVVYRSEQKAIVRQWWTATKRDLKDTMYRLEQLVQQEQKLMEDGQDG